jgi:hypothetical protein
MALNLNVDYVRKDSASPIDTYYGYILTPNATDGEAVFAIRKVAATASIETVTWANGDPQYFSSKWQWRQASFAAPTLPLSITWSTTQDTYYKTVEVSWNLIKGVDIYLVDVRTESGTLLNLDGLPLQGPYVTRNYTTDLVNKTSVSAAFLNPGTYSITITGKNVAGSTSSTATFNFS